VKDEKEAVRYPFILHPSAFRAFQIDFAFKRFRVKAFRVVPAANANRVIVKPTWIAMSLPRVVIIPLRIVLISARTTLIPVEFVSVRIEIVLIPVLLKMILFPVKRVRVGVGRVRARLHR
jgi:hypothetical protein